MAPRIAAVGQSLNAIWESQPQTYPLCEYSCFVALISHVGALSRSGAAQVAAQPIEPHTITATPKRHAVVQELAAARRLMLYSPGVGRWSPPGRRIGAVTALVLMAPDPYQQDPAKQVHREVTDAGWPTPHPLARPDSPLTGAKYADRSVSDRDHLWSARRAGVCHHLFRIARPSCTLASSRGPRHISINSSRPYDRTSHC